MGQGLEGLCRQQESPEWGWQPRDPPSPCPWGGLGVGLGDVASSRAKLGAGTPGLVAPLVSLRELPAAPHLPWAFGDDLGR